MAGQSGSPITLVRASFQTEMDCVEIKITLKALDVRERFKRSTGFNLAKIFKAERMSEG